MTSIRKSRADLKSLYTDAEATEQYWQEDWSSRDYESMVSFELYNHTYKATVDTFVEQNHIQAGHKVLDVGCGWGRMLVGLLRNVKDLSVTGIDVSAEAISRAPEIIRKEVGPASVDVRVSKAEALPFDDDQFDCVVSTRVFQYISDTSSAMNEIKRVLKPGGRVTICVPNKLNPVRYLTYHTQMLTTRDLQQWMGEAGLEPVDCGTIVFFPPRLKRFSEDSAWVKIDKMISRIPLVNRIGGLAWASAVKNTG